MIKIVSNNPELYKLVDVNKEDDADDVLEYELQLKIDNNKIFLIDEVEFCHPDIKITLLFSDDNDTMYICKGDDILATRNIEYSYLALIECENRVQLKVEDLFPDQMEDSYEQNYPMLTLNIESSIDYQLKTTIKYRTDKDDYINKIIYSKEYNDVNWGIDDAKEKYDLYKSRLAALLNINLQENYIYHKGTLYDFPCGYLLPEMQAVPVNSIATCKIIDIVELLENYEIVPLNKKSVIIYEGEVVDECDKKLKIDPSIFMKLLHAMTQLLELDKRQITDSLKELETDLKKIYNDALEEIYDNSKLFDVLKERGLVIIRHGVCHQFNDIILEQASKIINQQ